jgi:hypothetical protein
MRNSSSRYGTGRRRGNIVEDAPVESKNVVLRLTDFAFERDSLKHTERRDIARPEPFGFSVVR